MSHSNETNKNLVYRYLQAREVNPALVTMMSLIEEMDTRIKTLEKLADRDQQFRDYIHG